MFKRGSVNSFNQITVDGDTSTNDCVIGLASGLAGGPGALKALSKLKASKPGIRRAGFQCGEVMGGAAAGATVSLVH